MAKFGFAVDTTDSWTYTIATYRQANANMANQFSMVIGVAETLLMARVDSSAQPVSSAEFFAVGIGIDTSTTNSAQTMTMGGSFNAAVNSNVCQVSAQFRGYPTIGKHDIRWLEISDAVGTTTWYGDNGRAFVQSGIHGEFLG